MIISERLQLAADELGIRLETVGGVTVWEAHPVVKHQIAIARIQSSIRSSFSTGGGEFTCLPSVMVRFLDGSLKRPDISIFCRMPDEEESAITLLPEAVIEILSKGYEAKDLVIGVPFYLAQGVKDVLIFDPYNNRTKHFRRDGQREQDSPVEIALECGCICTV